MYLLVVLMCLLAVTGAIMTQADHYIYFRQNREEFRQLNILECQIVNRIKQRYRDYEEESETLYYDGFRIDIVCEGMDVTFEITGPKLTRKRKFTFDDLNDCIIDYY